MSGIRFETELDVRFCRTADNSSSCTVVGLSEPSGQCPVHFRDVGQFDLVIAHAAGRHRNQPLGPVDTFHVEPNFDSRIRRGANRGKLLLPP